jgi:predicted RNA polymerase sigma factor
MEPEVEALTQDLDGYHLFHATRAELPLALTGNPAERSLVERRLLDRAQGCDG